MWQEFNWGILVVILGLILIAVSMCAVYWIFHNGLWCKIIVVPLDREQ